MEVGVLTVCVECGDFRALVLAGSSPADGLCGWCRLEDEVGRSLKGDNHVVASDDGCERSNVE